MSSYADFLASKQPRRKAFGFEPTFIPASMFDFQADLTRYSVRQGRGALFADCGLGKGHPDGTKLLTPHGWTVIEQIQKGDVLIGSDGTPCQVTGVYPRGEQPIYEVYFDDGTSLLVDSSHLWAVKNFNDKARKKDWRILSTEHLRHTNLKYGTHGQSRTWHIPMVQPVDFEEQELPLDPYVLGVLLGDGSLTHGNVGWSKPDVFIAEKIKKRLSGLYRVNGKSGGCWSIVTEPRGACNPIRSWLKENRLDVKSDQKFVPSIFLFSSYRQRLQLLRGLMDTDGYAGESPEFSSSSQQLAEAVVFLAQSFGGVATINLKEEPTYEHAGEMRIGLPSYRVVLSLPGLNPFSLPRKRNAYRQPRRGLGKWIDRIEYRGKRKSTCISVDSADSLYVADHFIVTHNSLMELVSAENIVRKTNGKVLLLTPLAVAAQMVREADKFGIEVKRTKQGEVHKGINITNYQRLAYYDPKDFVAVIADESSIVKNFDGKTRKSVTDFMQQVEFRLLATATPAPNDFMELGTSAEALGMMTRNSMLGMFFTNDGESTQQWRLKGHAKKRFWQWLASWARAVRKPSDLGYPDGKFQLPPLEVKLHKVKSEVKHGLFPRLAATLAEQRREKRQSLRIRCEKASEVLPDDVPCLVWCQLNDEADLLTELIPDAVQVAGSDDDDVKEERLNAFALGQIRCLVTKPSIASFGLNLQVCADMSYFPTHSHEAFYQSIRRCHRFGQENPVTVNLVYSEAEANVLSNMLRKEKASGELYDGIIRHMHEFQQERKPERYNGHLQVKVPAWL